MEDFWIVNPLIRSRLGFDALTTAGHPAVTKRRIVTVDRPTTGATYREKRGTMSINTSRDQIVFPPRPTQDAPIPAPKGKGARGILLSVLGGAVLLTGIGIGASNSTTTTTVASPEVTKTVEVPAAAPAPASPAPAPAPAAPAPPPPVPKSDAAVPFGGQFDAGNGNWISVSAPTTKTGLVDKPVTLVEITLHNGSAKAMEVDSFTIFTEANHGANGKTADWAILDSTPIDGAALPGKSVTGEYAFEGQLDNPVTIQVKVGAWDATAYFGG